MLTVRSEIRGESKIADFITVVFLENIGAVGKFFHDKTILFHLCLEFNKARSLM